MLIEVWSDVACPWCYIGKRRLEGALAALAEAHPAAGAGGDERPEVRWRSFQLDPGAPQVAEGGIAEHLGAKYGGGREAGQRMIDQMEAVAAEDGLLYSLGRARRVSTYDAHRLLHAALAVSPQVQDDLKERLLAAYQVEGLSVADHDELVRLAEAAGLDAATARRVLDGAEHADGVESDFEQAAAYGISGVPFTVVDRRYAVSGAQPVEVYLRALEQAWQDAHPAAPALVSVSAEAGGEAGGEVCGPDGCTP